MQTISFELIEGALDREPGMQPMPVETLGMFWNLKEGRLTCSWRKLDDVARARDHDSATRSSIRIPRYIEDTQHDFHTMIRRMLPDTEDYER
jgi:hypothetical protein